jgi:hypothetical protein
MDKKLAAHEVRAYEVVKVALLLYNWSPTHQSNKTVEEFIPRAIVLLEAAAAAIEKAEL